MVSIVKHLGEYNYRKIAADLITMYIDHIVNSLFWKQPWGLGGSYSRYIRPIVAELLCLFLNHQVKELEPTPTNAVFASFKGFDEG